MNGRKMNEWIERAKSSLQMQYLRRKILIRVGGEGFYERLHAFLTECVLGN